MSGASFLLISAAASVLCGCMGTAPEVKIPDSARLLYMGTITKFNGTRPAGPGRAYLYDDTTRQLVSVLAVSADQDFQFSIHEMDHRYRVYFEPDASLKQATSQPSY